MLRLELEFADFTKRKTEPESKAKLGRKVVLDRWLWSVVFSFSAPQELVSVISRINKESAVSADTLIRKNTNNVLQWRVDNVVSLHYKMQRAEFSEAHNSLMRFDVGYDFWKISSYVCADSPVDEKALIKCQQDLETELQALDEKFESKVHEKFKGNCGLINCFLSSVCCIGALIPSLVCTPVPSLYAGLGTGVGSPLLAAGNGLIKKQIYDECAEACCLGMTDSTVAKIKDHLVQMKEVTGIPAGLRKKSLFEKELTFFQASQVPQVEDKKDDPVNTINFIV